MRLTHSKSVAIGFPSVFYGEISQNRFVCVRQNNDSFAFKAFFGNFLCDLIVDTKTRWLESREFQWFCDQRKSLTEIVVGKQPTATNIWEVGIPLY